MVMGAGMRDGRTMAPSLLDLDILRASLGPALVASYEHRRFGAAPWLTAGTLTWPDADAPAVLSAWRAWAESLPPSAFTAVRVSEHVVAIDVALVGDPWGVPARLAPLRALAPAADTVGLAAPVALLGRRGGAPAPVAAAAAPLASLPDLWPLVAARVPDGIALGARQDAADGPALIAVGIAAEAPRLHAALAALDRAHRVRVGIG
jgi:hypothetical protein